MFDQLDYYKLDFRGNPIYPQELNHHLYNDKYTQAVEEYHRQKRLKRKYFFRKIKIILGLSPKRKTSNKGNR